MARLRSYNRRNDAVAALRDEDVNEALAWILVAFYDLALEYCAGQGITLSDSPGVSERRHKSEHAA